MKIVRRTAVLILVMVILVAAGEIGWANKDRGAAAFPKGVTTTSAGPVDVVWLGDSLALGMGVDNWNDTLAGLVAAKYHQSNVLVLAKSGARASDVANSQLPSVPKSVKQVYVMVGANDVTHLSGGGEFDNWLREISDGLPDGAKVTFIGVPDVASSPRFVAPLSNLVEWRVNSLDSKVKLVASVKGARYVEVKQTGKEFESNPGKYLCKDEYHPSKEGYQLWANLI